MSQEKTIDVETVSAPQSQGMVVRNEQTQLLTPSQMRSRLDAIQSVMKEAMKEGQDYGRVPGCGDKPGLFQPGAQKLSMMFQLNPEVKQEIVTDYANYHRGFRFVVRVTNGEKFAEGVGECSTLESKYRYRSSGRKCPECGKETIIKGKQEYGGGYLCFQKKGGCGWKCNDGTPAAKGIEEQTTGKVEHDNPPDFWNTVRKMGFKRAFVAAIINATNTSELWSQDLEDLAANGVVQAPPEAPKRSQDDDVPMDFPNGQGDKQNGSKPKPVGKSGKRGMTPHDTAGGAPKDAKKEETERKTLLQVFRKKIEGNNHVESEIVRFFQNVPSQSAKWKGQLLLGFGIDGSLDRMALDKLEFVIQHFDKWIMPCSEWCKANPVKA